MRDSNAGDAYHEASHEIQRATSNLLYADNLAKSACASIKENLGYDFVAIQLTELLQKIIETVHGVGAHGEWYKLASHSLEVSDEFRDIQAHVAISRPPVIEIAAGCHPRFDPFIFAKYGHEHYVRAFVPLILGRTRDGKLTRASTNDFTFETDGSGNRVIQLVPKTNTYEIIGTVEAGFDNSSHEEARHISDQEARALFSAACEQATKIYAATLWHILQIIVEHARKLSGAASAAILFPQEANLLPQEAKSQYQVWSGLDPAKYDRSLATSTWPIAAEAPSPSLMEAAPDPCAHGLLTLAFLPERSTTLKGRVGSPNFKTFLDHAGDALRHATLFLHSLHLTRRLANLHDIAEALAYEPDHPDLLETIAGHAQNVLAADVVAIYDAHEGELRGDYGIVGARSSPPPFQWAPSFDLLQGLKKGNPVRYADSPEKLAKLYYSDEEKHFMEREQIKSTAIAPLRVSRDVVGVMAIYFRRNRLFSVSDMKSIETVASTAAIAIRTKQLLRRREDDVEQLLHDLSGMLDGMVRTASSLKRQSDSMAGQADILQSISRTVRMSLRDDVSAHDEACQQLDVRNVLDRIWSVVRQNHVGRRVQLDCKRGSGTSPHIYWNRSALIYVSYALLDNAGKYADEDSTVHVECIREAGGWSRISVSSTGLPISDHEEERVFGKFTRGEAARQAGNRKGVGLGLFIARNVMQLHGGCLNLKRNGRTSCFVISIPAQSQIGFHACRGNTS